MDDLRQDPILVVLEYCKQNKLPYRYSALNFVSQVVAAVSSTLRVRNITAKHIIDSLPVVLRTNFGMAGDVVMKQLHLSTYVDIYNAINAFIACKIFTTKEDDNLEFLLEEERSRPLLITLANNSSVYIEELQKKLNDLQRISPSNT